MSIALKRGCVAHTTRRRRDASLREPHPTRDPSLKNSVPGKGELWWYPRVHMKKAGLACGHLIFFLVLVSGVLAEETYNHIASASYATTCVILDDDSLKCWGSPYLGGYLGGSPFDMGDNLPVVDLGTGRTVKGIFAGYYHVCAILDDDSVKCWGQGAGGATGYGTSTGNIGDGPGEMGDALPPVDLGTGRTAKTLSLGGWHSCAILDNDMVKCWGFGQYGQLGSGTADQGDDPGEMGDNLPYVDLGTDRTAKQLALGEQHSCALLDNDDVKCFGRNVGYPHAGTLGYGDSTTRGTSAATMGDNLPAVNFGAGRTAVQIAAGKHFTCAILDDGNVKCWGFNDVGQLGLGDTTTRSAPDDVVVNLGSGRTAKSIHAGNGAQACAILDDDGLKCWGYNDAYAAPGNEDYPLLGIGEMGNRGDGAGEMGDALPYVDLGTGRTAKDVACGAYTTCATLDDATVKCWGRNHEGQLGLGDYTSRGGNAGEMGDNLPTVNLGSGRTAKPVVVSSPATPAPAAPATPAPVTPAPTNSSTPSPSPSENTTAPPPPPSPPPNLIQDDDDRAPAPLDIFLLLTITYLNLLL